jgi:hypothetical protein
VGTCCSDGVQGADNGPIIATSDPKNPVQITYHRPENSFSFVPYWYKGRVFVTDWNHSVMAMKLTPGTGAKVTLRTIPVKTSVRGRRLDSCC